MKKGFVGAPAAYTRAVCVIVLAVVILVAVCERQRIIDAFRAGREKRDVNKILEP